MPSSSPIQGVGLIGAGVIFADHAKAWRALRGRAQCIGVAEVDDVKRASATRDHFFPVDVSDYHDLLNRDDIDIVGICTPPFLHEQMISEALSAGKYVLCEKPLAPNLASLDRIIGIAAAYPGRLSTIYQLRYEPDMQKMLWLKERGYLGTIQSGMAERRASLGGSSALRGGWWGRWNVSGGGVVMTQFIHHLDQLLCIFGKAQRVEAKMSTECQPIESEDSFQATIEFENQVTVQCEATVNAPKFRWGIDVNGESLTAHLPWSLTSTDSRRLQSIGAELEAKFGEVLSLRQKVVRRAKKLAGKRVRSGQKYVNSHEPYFRAVLDAIAENRSLPIGPDEARASVELCTAIYTSALTDSPVELPLDSSCQFYEGITVEDYRTGNRAIA